MQPSKTNFRDKDTHTERELMEKILLQRDAIIQYKGKVLYRLQEDLLKPKNIKHIKWQKEPQREAETICAVKLKSLKYYNIK